MRVPSPPRIFALVAALLVLATPAQADPQAPGDFSGLGFDTCQAPSQATMDAWKSASPFGAIGIYVSGNSRYCGDAYQPNLTPTWVKTNADHGWKFLPIHVGYQSPCFVNNPKSRVQKKHMSSDVNTARGQAQSDAGETIAALRRLGFGPGSVSYLDLEFYKRTSACDNVTLEFIDAWTETLHANGYKSGVYSSGSAAIKALDDALAAGRSGFDVPDHIWIAWTNGKSDTNGGPYLSSRWFTNHQRIHQFKNGVSETFGGKTLNIDWNALDVGGGSVPRTQPAGTPKTSSKVARAAAGSTPTLHKGSSGSAVRRLQKALSATGRKVPTTGYFGQMTASAVKSYRKKNGLGSGTTVTRTVWKALQSGASR